MAGRPLHESLAEAARQYPEHAGLLVGDERWSFARLDAMAAAAASLLAAHGVRRGDRVAVMLGNRLEFAPVVFGISRLGAATVLISPAWKEREVRHALDVVDASHAVAEDASLAVLGPCLDGAAIVHLDDGPTANELHSKVTNPAPPVEVDADADAVLVFSSGTTGMPKAVRHTHRSMGHATDHWTHTLGLTHDDRFQVATPPSHILGLLNLLAAAAAGATVRLHHRFDLDALLGAIEADRITLEMAVAPIALAMANHPRIEDFDLSSLRYVMWGATPVTPHVAEAVTARTGVRWLPAYGASEVPVIAVNPVERPDAWRLDSAGVPAPGIEVRIADLDTGEALAPGGIGEIQVRSPSVMAGYLPAEATAVAFADGWYRTGDVGWQEPDGWLHLTDRAKEMIKVKGFQVAPAEVEAVLLGHPAVLDCAVFGLADPVAGEVPVGVVQLDSSIEVAPGELESLVADSLATYKQLRHLVVVDTIPRLASGKVLRRTLRDELSPTLTGSVGHAG